ncbi:hypothetical protein [Methanonatronarchaeum sp. AMET6-2]|uniref:hypothetical protein n=1 Tax=Methanonatronarchaeum sp. AMET6-2 TaxID=2933293 RepID=UPI0012117D77|nr:hypothetical protein [Methanonatronarchaeum sp. AMET6-2]RZN63173.1 MAG: hypothetical protein EF811_00920 [Methanonatronarchaeia archaeon]UOY09463.1 hypothetical protein MU439_04205 [Methanonatronarchaeum sp. AMET6-2]
MVNVLAALMSLARFFKPIFDLVMDFLSWLLYVMMAMLAVASWIFKKAREGELTEEMIRKAKLFLSELGLDI